MKIDNNGLEVMECPTCSKTSLEVTNDLSFDSVHLNVYFECSSCDQEYRRDYEALYVGFENCEDFPHLPQEEFNVNEDESGESFDITCCYNCKSEELSPSDDPFFGEDYVHETYTCDDCGLETNVEFYDCDGFSQE
jgi:hypothetical protein